MAYMNASLRSASRALYASFAIACADAGIVGDRARQQDLAGLVRTARRRIRRARGQDLQLHEWPRDAQGAAEWNVDVAEHRRVQRGRRDAGQRDVVVAESLVAGAAVVIPERAEPGALDAPHLARCTRACGSASAGFGVRTSNDEPLRSRKETLR